MLLNVYAYNKNIELQKRTLNEIKRRLSILSKQWTEERLSLVVQREMTKLATGGQRERERE